MNRTKPTYPLRLIDARDLAELRKISMSAAYQSLEKIKKGLGKMKHQYVTNQEAAKYLGIKIADFEEIIKG